MGSIIRLLCLSKTAVCIVNGETGLLNTSFTDIHNATETGLSAVGNKWSSYNFWICLTLAVLSAFLIEGSVMLKKKALLRLAYFFAPLHPSEGGHGYLKDWLWWGGLLTMGAGEAANFAAYMFAPATVVIPFGTLSVLISAVLSSYLLGETLNLFGKLGCVLSVLGSILMVIHAPEEEEVTTLHQMTDKLLDPGFLVFASIQLVACLLLIFYFSPCVGQTNILVYIGTCCLLGAFTVSSVKGLGIAIRTVLSDPAVVRHPLTWILLASLVSSIVIQVNYLNKSLDTFNTLLVYPIYYVCFTTIVLTTSIIMFQEWGTMSGVDVVCTMGGILVIVLGMAMLHLFKDIHVTLEGLTSSMCQVLEEKQEDKHILIEEMESLPPMREDVTMVFIIS
ncbi:magnesium transporter NIPA2-like [Salvelinus alpinus]|uniref:magnesium transporter NIPA2-like n=1 Tax=Salvelinus alpinus TaxID=8036 RepID=UPI0039FCB83A